MKDNAMFQYAQGENLEFLLNFINTANEGRSNNYIGEAVIANLILALKDTNARLKALEDTI